MSLSFVDGCFSEVTGTTHSIVVTEMLISVSSVS